MSREPGNVQDILTTLLVPMEPPNRSQWKKLELAMKFIHLSKESVARTKKSQKSQVFIRVKICYVVNLG